MDNPVAANVLGTAGAVCWSVQLIPQIIINYRRHNTIGLQDSMMMLWAWAGVPLGVYNVTKEFSVALQIQPQILTLLSLVTWIQCRYYDKHWSVVRCLAVAIPIALLMAGTQIALIFALRAADSSHLTWPDILMAVLSAALLAAGVLRHYWDIYIHRSVRGISFIFVGIDAAGDLFSLISIFFQPELDVLGMVIYGTELVLWLGVFACGGYFNLLPWVKKTMKLSESESKPQAPNASETMPNADSGVHDMSAAHTMVLHNLPSSTSVFRTPSSEFAISRARAGFASNNDEAGRDILRG